MADLRTWLRNRFRPKRATEGKIRQLHHMLMLTPASFELAVADLLRDMGFKRASQTGGAGDLAADIVGKDEEGRSTIVQCKQYMPGRSVGSREIQLFIGMSRTHHRAERAIFVTTSTFTKPAVELASKHKIELIDGDELARLLVDVRGEPEFGPDLTFYDMLDLGSRGVVDAFKAMSVMQQYTEQRLEEARAAGCQCAIGRGDAITWMASEEIWEEHGRVVLWCPDCGRPATDEEISAAREQMTLPPR